MSPDVVVDIGNTRIKFGLCAGGAVAKAFSLPAEDTSAWARQLKAWQFAGRVHWAVSSVHPERLGRFGEWAAGRGDQVVAFADYGQLPVRVEVDEPAKVGIDRLFNAVAFLRDLPPGTPGVIIDVGTAVTVDLLDGRHVFVGGAILPGPRLMFEVLNRQTAKLPFIDLHEVPTEAAPGKNTRDAMAAGVRAAVTAGCEQLVREYAASAATPPWLMMTGGALGALAGHRFPGVGPTFTHPLLTLEGIRLAAEALP